MCSDGDSHLQRLQARTLFLEGCSLLEWLPALPLGGCRSRPLTGPTLRLDTDAYVRLSFQLAEPHEGVRSERQLNLANTVGRLGLLHFLFCQISDSMTTAV